MTDKTDRTAINTSISNQLILTFLSLDAECIQIPLMPTSEPLSNNICYHNLDLSKSEATVATQELITKTGPKDALIFTDGSYEATRGGGAAAILTNTGERQLYHTGRDRLQSNHKCEI